MAGAKQPIELIKAKGKKHLTKSEILEREQTEVKANADKIEPPSYLPEELKERFNRIANELINMKIMSNLDCEALARFIISEHQYEKVTIELLKIKTISNKYLTYVALQEKFFKMSRSAASDLGLTISSRCKLVVPKQEKEKPPSKFAKFGAGMNA